MPNLTLIARTLQTLFNAEATRLARESGLVQRHSKLSGPLILLVLVAGFIQQPCASYNILAQVAADYGVSVTRQAIQQRLTSAAVGFFQQLLAHCLEALQTQCRLPLPLLTQFSGVYLLDSTQVALPAALSGAYPGTGPADPAAGLKWQVLWELLSGCLQQVVGQPAREPDQLYYRFLPQVAAGSLLLFDLGYVALARLEQLVERQIYFVCRWNPRFAATTSAGWPFDLGAYLARTTEDALELDLRVGMRAQLPLRVVALRLPAAAREIRRRRAHAKERQFGLTYSTAYKALLDWNIYATNVPIERLTGEQVRQVYRLRWQVELLFKLWKAQGELDRVAGQHSGRVMCELYAKLIGMAVFSYLIAPVRLGPEQELSAVRSWQVWQRQIATLGMALRAGQGLAGALSRLYRLWAQFGQKDQRAKRVTSLGQLQAERRAPRLPADPVWLSRVAAQPDQDQLAA